VKPLVPAKKKGNNKTVDSIENSTTLLAYIHPFSQTQKNNLHNLLANIVGDRVLIK
jgi:hypothetical protein